MKQTGSPSLQTSKDFWTAILARAPFIEMLVRGLLVILLGGVLCACDSSRTPEREASRYNGLLATALLQQNDYADAIADYTRALQGDLSEEQRVQGLILRGSAYRQEGQLDAANADFSAALELDSDSTSARIGQATILMDEGRLGEAEILVKAAIGLKPNQAATHVLLGKIYLTDRAYEQSLAEFDAAIALRSYSPDAYLGRGRGHMALNHPELAFADDAAAAKLAPDDPDVPIALADLEMSLGHCDRAKLDANKALSLNQAYALAFRERGATESCMAQYEASAADLAAGLAISPYDSYATMWLYLARAHLKENGTAELLAFLTRRPKEGWPDPIFNYFLGQSTATQLQDAAASQGDAVVQENRGCEAAYYIGEIAALHGEKDRGLLLLKKALHTCPIDFFEHSFARAELDRLSR